MLIRLLFWSLSSWLYINNIVTIISKQLAFNGHVSDLLDRTGLVMVVKRYNNILVMLGGSALFMKEIGVPSEDHRHAASNCKSLSKDGDWTHNGSGDTHWAHTCF